MSNPPYFLLTARNTSKLRFPELGSDFRYVATEIGMLSNEFWPASAGWPVFPTQHAPSLQKTAKEHLQEEGWTKAEIKELLDEQSIDAILREYEITPPAVTIRGARSLMKRLCEEADVEINGEYLKPHGARRSLGDTLYRESAELAQSALRHSSVRTTHKSYSHIEAAETADEVGKIIEESLSSPDDEKRT